MSRVHRIHIDSSTLWHILYFIIRLKFLCGLSQIFYPFLLSFELLATDDGIAFILITLYCGSAVLFNWN